MHSVLYFMFSLLEGAALFILMFSLFRFNIRVYLPQIIFVNIVVAVLSYYLRVYENLYSIVPLINVLILILFLWLLFRVPLLYSIIMGVAGSIIFVLLQALTLFGLSAIGATSFNEIRADISTGYLLQALTIVISLLVSMIIHRYRLWFVFVPTDYKVKIPFKAINVIVLFVSVLTVIIFGIVFSLSDLTEVIIIFVLIFLLIIYVLIKKEYSDD